MFGDDLWHCKCFMFYAGQSHKCIDVLYCVLNKDLKEKRNPGHDPVFQHHIIKTVKMS